MSRLYLYPVRVAREKLGSFIKGFVLWLILSVPIGLAVGAVFSAFLGQGAEIDRFTAAGNGAIAGAWIGLVAAWAATTTTTLARPRLKNVGGSELVTGLLVSIGFIIGALGLLRLFG